MKYIFDSDAITAFIKADEEDENDIFLNFMETFENPEFYISILTIYEYEFGISALKGDDKEKESRILDDILDLFEIIPLTRKDAKIYGELKQGFKKKTGINKNALKRHNIDIALASVAIANDYILVAQDSIYSDHLQVINPKLQHLNWR